MSGSQSGSLIFLNLPPKTFIGLDLITFNSSAQFQGIHNIRHGLHLLYSGTDASLSIRQGRWVNLTPDDPRRILQWNADSESLDLLDDEAESAQNVISSARDPSRGLLDYEALQAATSDLAAKQSTNNGNTSLRSTKHRDGAEEGDDAEVEEDQGNDNGNSDPDDQADPSTWQDLTSHISPTLLTRILQSEWTTTSVASAPSDTETIPGLSHLEANDALHQHPLHLTVIDLKQTWAADDVGRVRTDRARDRSWYLSTLVDAVSLELVDTETPSATAREKTQNERKTVGARGLLGELQFCFLMVLTLANYSCLEQWKRILVVFFTCHEALRDVEPYFVQMVRVMGEQMRRVEDVEGGLFELRDEVSSAWLRRYWARFRAAVDVHAADGGVEDLKREVERLQSFFEDRYGWASERDRLRRGMLELEDGEMVEVSLAGVDEDEETGEYAPVVVEM
ncbi:hypothetical protein LTR84_012733 [Exophiala bonariae]|uniref:A1 cistron-splicing factor n=1 Tax=Exophiala bonariae TaxID=1690606 RepID=A0AAV9NFW3_9EURO|nr:hypothetical protein LTR84_012733 [Exophiala bonariae]